jgi:cell division protein FtsB
MLKKKGFPTMTNDITKNRTADSLSSSSSTDRGAGTRKPSGYSRVKSGDLRRRSVTRTPDMSNPNGRIANPNVAVGSLPAVKEKKKDKLIAAPVYVEPKVRTINDTKKEAFPYSIIFLSLICSVLFFYMIFNYVQINEHTAAVSGLKNEISTLATEKNDLSAKLDQKNDLVTIEKIAREELGMVKIDEITKKYITMDPGDTITPYGSEMGDSNAD